MSHKLQFENRKYKKIPKSDVSTFQVWTDLKRQITRSGTRFRFQWKKLVIVQLLRSCPLHEIIPQVAPVAIIVQSLRDLFRHIKTNPLSTFVVKKSAWSLEFGVPKVRFRNHFECLCGKKRVPRVWNLECLELDFETTLCAFVVKKKCLEFGIWSA